LSAKKKEILSGFGMFKYSGLKAGKQVFFYGVFLTLLFLVFTLSKPGFLPVLENKLYDIMHDSIKHKTPPLPVIVDIDEKSLAQMGQWPWPRYQIAELLTKISDAGATSIGLDILFPEPDRTSVSQVKQELLKEFGMTLDLENIPDHLHDNDIYFAKTLKNGPFILGYKFVFERTPNIPTAPVPLDLIVLNASESNNINTHLFMAKGTIESLPVFSEAINSSGFVNVRPDADGVIRRIPLLIGYKDQIYPSLALAMVMNATNINQGMLKVSDAGVEGLYLNDTRIPLDKKGRMLIRYRGKKGSFDYISAIDILNGKIGIKEKLANKIVFVGTSATGLKDSYVTPVDTLFPGVEVHATIADNILNNAFLSRPIWSKGVEVVITLIIGILVSFILAYLSPFMSLVFPGIFMFALWFGALELLKTGDMFFSPLYPLINGMGCFAFLSLLRFRMAEKESQKRTMEIQHIESELNVAREIQMGVIPKVFPPFPDQDCFDLFANLIPAKEVGGDLYDFFFLNEEHLCFIIGDVADKGVPASLFMMRTRTLVKNLAPFYNSPSNLMEKVNDILSTDNPKSLFVTLVIGVLNLKTGRVTYANGGHNLPVIFSVAQGVFFKQGISGPVAGVMGSIPYEDLSITLEPGDGIFLYTDGVTEAMDKEKIFFTEKKLIKICKTVQNESAEKVVKTVLQQVRQHAGAESQSDDIAMMMLRFCKPQKMKNS